MFGGNSSSLNVRFAGLLAKSREVDVHIVFLLGPERKRESVHFNLLPKDFRITFSKTAACATSTLCALQFTKLGFF
jgi:hypothetical protein